MGQHVIGGGLVLIGLSLWIFFGFDRIGVYNVRPEILFLLYGYLIMIIGIGVYIGEIRFIDDAEWRYEGQIFLFAITMILILVGLVVLFLS